MKRYFLLFISILFLVISCDYGLSSGSDLEGKWVDKKDDYIKCYRFYKDKSGYYEYKVDTTSHADWNNKDFTWNIEETTSYKKLKVQGDLKTTFEYYFSTDKNNLYLKEENQCCFSTYYKIFK